MESESKKKIQSVRMNLQNGQVNIIINALELYKYNLKYMLDTERCSDKERQEKYSLIDQTIKQVKQIQAEQVNGKSESVETSSEFSNTMPEIEMIKGIIPLDKTAMVG